MTPTTITRTPIAAAMGASGMTTQASGRGVTIALIDTGVAPSPMLATANIVVGPDFSGEAATPGLDTNGHGTHLAGIIASAAPSARLLSLKAGAADGQTHPSHVIAAINWLVDAAPTQGLCADVLVLAYCIDANLPEAALIEAAVSRAWDAGITVVAAAGNTGTAGVQAPAASTKTIAVGGAQVLDGNVTIADFATTGDDARALDLIAPGRSIISARAIGSSSDAVNEAGRVGEHLVAATGSSQSAALVGAAAALLLEGRNLTNDQVKGLLTSTAGEGASLNLAAAAELAGPAVIVDHITELDLNETIVGFQTEWAGARWSGARWSGISWSGISWSGISWSGISWSGISWSGISWSGISWSGARWAGISWSGARWAGISWSGARWAGISWSGARWAGISWSGARWAGISWSGTAWG